MVEDIKTWRLDEGESSQWILAIEDVGLDALLVDRTGGNASMEAPTNSPAPCWIGFSIRLVRSFCPLNLERCEFFR